MPRICKSSAEVFYVVVLKKIGWERKNSNIFRKIADNFKIYEEN